MTAFVDTNVLLRHLTGDPPGQAARTARLLSRAGPAPGLGGLRGAPPLFADAYLVAEAETSGVNAVASFDTTIERVPTVGRVEP